MKSTLFMAVVGCLFLTGCVTQKVYDNAEEVKAEAITLQSQTEVKEEKTVSENEITEKVGNNSSSGLAEIEAYLNNIKYLTTSFEQISPDGQVVNGKFYLSRPGKIRIDYTPNMPIIIVVNGSLVTYQDLELEEISHISSDAVPTSFLARKHISFSDKDVVLKSFDKTSKSYRVSIAQGGKEENGEFTLIFGRNPLKLEMLEVKDAMDSVTRLRFFDSVFGKKISNSKFKVKDPRLPE